MEKTEKEKNLTGDFIKILCVMYVITAFTSFGFYVVPHGNLRDSISCLADCSVYCQWFCRGISHRKEGKKPEIFMGVSHRGSVFCNSFWRVSYTP